MSFELHVSSYKLQAISSNLKVYPLAEPVEAKRNKLILDNRI